MMPPVYYLARYRAGRSKGWVRVYAATPREAFQRVRRERPDYVRDVLILRRVEKDPRGRR